MDALYLNRVDAAVHRHSALSKVVMNDVPASPGALQPRALTAATVANERNERHVPIDDHRRVT